MTASSDSSRSMLRDFDRKGTDISTSANSTCHTVTASGKLAAENADASVDPKPAAVPTGGDASTTAALTSTQVLPTTRLKRFITSANGWGCDRKDRCINPIASVPMSSIDVCVSHHAPDPSPVLAHAQVAAANNQPVAGNQREAGRSFG